MDMIIAKHVVRCCAGEAKFDKISAMKALLQRVSHASVSLPSGERRSVGRGLLILLGVGKQDCDPDADWLAAKTLKLRVFSNSDGKFDHSVADIKGELLVISQFTLYGDCLGGNRPDFTAAAPPAQATALYRRYAELLAASGLTVRTGEFGEHMKVELLNDGPVTVLLDSSFRAKK
ncbi:MAG TPA: D-aminoacyl-tRNA deacylase [Elusimicrobiales bacterium]|nr:D-aminoacyl-tRNA deacylase [Elusimicrobiales bacterium]